MFRRAPSPLSGQPSRSGEPEAFAPGEGAIPARDEPRKPTKPTAPDSAAVLISQSSLTLRRTQPFGTTKKSPQRLTLSTSVQGEREGFSDRDRPKYLNGIGLRQQVSTCQRFAFAGCYWSLPVVSHCLAMASAQFQHTRWRARRSRELASRLGSGAHVGPTPMHARSATHATAPTIRTRSPFVNSSKSVVKRQTRKD